jgi:hypothetical protein
MHSLVASELETSVQSALPWLRPLTEQTVSARPAPDRWTIKEVIGHLVDSAANNHQRFVRAQFASGEFVFPKYDQNEWVGAQHYNEVSWVELLDLWERYNRHLAHVIRHVPTAALTTICRIGPYEPVTLQFLIEDYVVHLSYHLQKIKERI